MNQKQFIEFLESPKVTNVLLSGMLKLYKIPFTLCPECQKPVTKGIFCNKFHEKSYFLFKKPESSPGGAG